MSGANFRLYVEGSEIEQAIREAVEAQLTPVAKEAMIADAVKNLCLQQRGRGSAPFEKAFNEAVSAVAIEVVQKIVASDEAVRIAIERKVWEAMSHLLHKNDGLAEAIGRTVAYHLIASEPDDSDA